MGNVELKSGGSALQLWPDTMRTGDRLHIAFLAPLFAGGPLRQEFEVTVLDQRRRVVATIARGVLRPAGGVVCTEWDGRDVRGDLAPPGRYLLRVVKPNSTFTLERTVFIEN